MVSPTASAAPSPTRPGRGWLFGPVPDLLLGCGIGYALLFVVMTFAGTEFRAAIPFGLAPLVALAAGTPHYGATLLRVYGRREDRRAYTKAKSAFIDLYWRRQPQEARELPNNGLKLTRHGTARMEPRSLTHCWADLETPVNHWQ